MASPVRHPGVWWLSPAGAIALVVPFTLLLAASLDDAQFRENWGTGKMLTSSTVALFALGAALFAIGGTWPLLLRGEPVRSSHWPHQTGRGVERLRVASSVVF